MLSIFFNYLGENQLSVTFALISALNGARSILARIKRDAASSLRARATDVSAIAVIIRRAGCACAISAYAISGSRVRARTCGGVPT